MSNRIDYKPNVVVDCDPEWGYIWVNYPDTGYEIQYHLEQSDAMLVLSNLVRSGRVRPIDLEDYVLSV